MSGCWLWVGSKASGAKYGRVGHGGRDHQAHRLIYELLVAPVPKSLHIDHLCKTPACVNPSHLEPVTPQENHRRGNSASAVNARKIACRRGHPFSGENLRRFRTGRRCKACDRIEKRAKRARYVAFHGGPRTPRRLGGAANGRVTHCPRAHAYDEANTRHYTYQGYARRICRACERIKSRSVRAPRPVREKRAKQPRVYRRRDPVAFFWSKVDKTESCWAWTWHRVGRGYGIFSCKNGRSNNVTAHRFSYELHVGPIPAGYVVDHLCRHPWCVRPDHLEAVPWHENQRRMNSRDRLPSPITYS